MTLYEDKRIVCDDEGITIRMYYLPAGRKKVRYSSIRGAKVYDITWLTGKGRIWGSGLLGRDWWNLDWSRTRKGRAIMLDVGKFWRPFITPDEPDAVLEIIRSKTGIEA